MTRKPRTQASPSEIVGALVAVAVLIGITNWDGPVFLQFRLPDAVTGIFVTLVNAALTYLVMLCLMPTWAIFAMNRLRLQRQADRYADWWASRHPFLDQRIECAIKAASAAAAEADVSQSDRFEERVLQVTAGRLDRLPYRVYHALSLQMIFHHLWAAGHYQEALERCAVALRLDLEQSPLVAELHTDCAELQYHFGRFADVLTYAEFAVATAAETDADTQSRAHSIAALALAEQGKPVEALQEIEQAVAVHPNGYHSLSAHVYRAWILWQNCNQEEAQSILDGMSKVVTKRFGPLYQDYHEIRARVLLEQNQPEAAEAEFKLVLEENAQNELALYHLARIAQSNKSWEQASEWERRLLQDAPESFYAERIRQARGTGVV